MAYVTRAQIAAVVASGDLLRALDDDKDNAEDSGLLDSIIAAADTAVDARIGPAVTLPLAAPYPAAVVNASRTFVCEILWSRRGMTGDNNPWKTQADTVREQLDRIGAGEEALPESATGGVAAAVASFTPHELVMDPDA